MSGAVCRGVFELAFQPRKTFGKQEGKEESNRISPQEVIQARMTLEPALAHQTALNGNGEQIETLHRIAAGSRRAATWRAYETLTTAFTAPSPSAPRTRRCWRCSTS